MSTQIAVVDSSGANLASLGYALKRLGVTYSVTRDADQIRAASHVILPGVGAAPPAMDRLRHLELDRLVPTLTQPVLGICLGLQLMTQASDEGPVDCLGICDGTATELTATPELPVPNMGWCPVTVTTPNPLFEDIADGSWFYFVHSFAVPVTAHTIGLATHDAPFSAAIQNGNFFATQFHPEKSAQPGQRLLKNFIELPS